MDHLRAVGDGPSEATLRALLDRTGSDVAAAANAFFDGSFAEQMAVEPARATTTSVVPVVVVNGIPIVAGNLGVDAVPLIDAQTVGILQAVDAFTVKQRVSLMEGCIDVSNMYDVYDTKQGNIVFTAAETSDDCDRCCCAPNHKFRVLFKPATMKLQRDQVLALPTVLTMDRPGSTCSCCNKKRLGYCICPGCPACADGFVLYAGDVQEAQRDANESYKLITPQTIGYAEQPIPWGGGFTPTVNVMDRADATDKFRPLAKVEGASCCFGGYSELCCESAWPVSKMEPQQLNQQILTGDLAQITKKKPDSMSAALREALTDSDTYTIEFAPGQLAPQQKATMISSLILVDYMFFEKDNGMCHMEGSKLKFTLFECYCAGCVCPCTFTIDTSNSGGQPAKSSDVSR